MSSEVQSSSRYLISCVAAFAPILAVFSIIQVKGGISSVGYIDGFSLARQADRVVASFEIKGDVKTSSRKFSDAKAMAVKALEREPLAASAVRNIALALDSEGRHQAARSAMFVSLKLTRRDLATQFWLIQDYGRKNNLDQVLYHVDQALRTKEEARVRLIPALHIAMSSPELIGPMVRMLKSRPPWGRHFWTGFESHPSSLQNLANVLIGLFRANAEVEPFVPRAVINQLAFEGQHAKAFEVYQAAYRLNLPRKGQFIGNSHFEKSSAGTAFDWMTQSSANVDAFVDNIEQKLFVTADGDGQHIAAKQTIRLPAGNYRFSAVSRLISGVSHDLFGVDLICAEKSEAAIDPIFETNLTKSTVREEFSISPGGCEFYTVRVLVFPMETSSSRSIEIDQISIIAISDL